VQNLCTSGFNHVRLIKNVLCHAKVIGSLREFNLVITKSLRKQLWSVCAFKLF